MELMFEYPIFVDLYFGNEVIRVRWWYAVYSVTSVLLWSLFPSLLCSSGNKHQNNPSMYINGLPLPPMHYSLCIGIDLYTEVGSCASNWWCIQWIYIRYSSTFIILGWMQHHFPLCACHKSLSGTHDWWYRQNPEGCFSFHHRNDRLSNNVWNHSLLVVISNDRSDGMIWLKVDAGTFQHRANRIETQIHYTSEWHYFCSTPCPFALCVATVMCTLHEMMPTALSWSRGTSVSWYTGDLQAQHQLATNMMHAIPY